MYKHGGSGTNAMEDIAGIESQLTGWHVTGLGDDALDLVVASHLRAVQHHRSHDVGVDSAVESLDA